VSAAPIQEAGTGWYLYGIVAARGEAPQVPGVDPRHEVVAIAQGDVAGIASQVSLTEFDETALPQRLGDAEWLEQKIRAHEQVLETALGSSAVVPCRFCTVYRDEDDLRAFLSERGEALKDALARVDGRVELGVKAFAGGAATRNPAGEAAGGRAYLEARREEQRAREELARSRGELAAALHKRLSGAAEDGVALDLQSRDVSGRDDEMVFNGAYLVAERERFQQQLSAVARDYSERGVELELTGPWPPYHFVPAELGRS
jgi:hypothetical protein